MKLERLTGAGKFLHPIAVEQNTGTIKDKNGKNVAEWTLFADDFARVTYLTGQDAIVVQQRRPTATHRVEMHERAGLKEDMRIVFKERVLYIRDISDPNAGEIQMVCEEAKD